MDFQQEINVIDLTVGSIISQFFVLWLSGYGSGMVLASFGIVLSRGSSTYL